MEPLEVGLLSLLLTSLVIEESDRIMFHGLGSSILVALRIPKHEDKHVPAHVVESLFITSRKGIGRVTKRRIALCSSQLVKSPPWCFPSWVVF